MSFSGFGKSSGPSIPPTTQPTFGRVPALLWRSPNSSPNSPIGAADIQNVQPWQQHQVIPPHGERPGAEMLLQNAIDEAPKIKSVPKNFESSSSVQAIFSDKQVQWPDSSPNRVTGERISSLHGDPSQNILSHAVPLSDAQNSGTFMSAKPANLVAPKRARSPVTSVERPLHSSSDLLDSEREMQAKAKRLARFHTELTKPLQTLNDLFGHKPSGNRKTQVPLVQKKAGEDTEDATYGDSFSEHEGAVSSNAVTGLCRDMCPELERDERERKGDLDKYERLNGDRNQTSKFLAVKKYNRMADREAMLIRPMPVLQKTVDYLLSLLNQPYDGNFLNIYNFLWDRMRAVRMDLRMQHIFNEDAIAMLEQMIRLHVIAMHELCEFEKGEGFTEGFDAHLNIEQMNKTSVELFQLYDDHRKCGKTFASEKEFRGYYALLKLDKHPGYKVEPTELSLDLAKMTAEMRSTPEILFARDVARACRIGNYIAFFRLARSATYLQSCLMHAHFSKLRKQALASLHSGLQNSQGVPVADVEEWLAMEGENVESLLEYHGFSIKNYGEAYMVKEGPFINGEMDFPTRCAQLVKLKRSKNVADDVRIASIPVEVFVERECTINTVDLFGHGDFINTGICSTASDEIMSDNNTSSTAVVLPEPSSSFQDRLPFIPNRESEIKMEEMPVLMASCTRSAAEDDGKNAIQDDSQEATRHDNDNFNGATLQVFESSKNQPAVHPSSTSCIIYGNSVFKKSESEKFECGSLLPLVDQKEEAKKDILKLILRKWKKHATMRRKNREQKEYLASAALSSLSLGPPIRQIESQQTWSYHNFDIEAIARVRLGKYHSSWSRLNISDLVAPILAARSPSARFFCWKLVYLAQPSDPNNHLHQLASKWLSFKLFSSSKEHDTELAVHSSGLSIWKKWSDAHGSSPQTCCLSVIREMVLDERQKNEGDDVVDGVSCLVYLFSETIPWEIQRARLQNFLLSIPPGSDLPLLILSIDSLEGDVAERSLNIIRRLALHYENEKRICSSSVIFLADGVRSEKFHGFFDDHQLRVGFQWLANKTPSVPSVRLARTRELALSCLRRFMEVTANHKENDVTPNDCVYEFNKTLNKLADDIRATASMNPTRWPPPEIDLLDKSSNERILASLCFPSAGWSSPTRINPIIRAINSCKLPTFPDTFWLNHESLTSEHIRQQKLALEKLLICYLNESNKLLKADLAAREVGIMIQKCVSLLFSGSGYRLAPRWIIIFQRIYSWRLNKLTAQGISNAYIMNDNDLFLVCPSLEEHQPFHSFPAEVSLDELIEISCSNPFERQDFVDGSRPLRSIGEAGNGAEAAMVDRDDEDFRCSSSFELVPELMGMNELVSASQASKSDRFTALFERCNRLQDMIDQKLAFYF